MGDYKGTIRVTTLGKQVDDSKPRVVRFQDVGAKRCGVGLRISEGDEDCWKIYSPGKEVDTAALS